MPHDAVSLSSGSAGQRVRHADAARDVLEYPDDPACDYLDRQYMLGDSVLVAPVSPRPAKCSFICGRALDASVA
ncbi:hypothetical protein [Algibacter miyuki]|uniref:hypothetical protein n=1 Tax=Algibacter miyuki TaxID=1306933 RepID=UPI003B004F5E